MDFYEKGEKVTVEILLLLVAGVINIICFLIGAKVGQTVSKGEVIEVPTVNPMKIIREHQDRKQAEKEQERIDVIMRNIESYDGTSRGQEEIPGR